MARKTRAPSATARPRTTQRAKPKRRPPAKKALDSGSFAMPPAASYGDMAKMGNLLTPEQAIELYKANARMALDIINASIEGTAKLRKLQFEGEESARAFHRKTARSAAEAKDPQSLMAIGQGAAQEAIQQSMHYWGEMFDLIGEIQKRVFTLIEEQAEGVPGVRQARAAMAMMPDLKPLENVVNAMKGVVGSGGNAFEQMQKVMGDFARVAQQSMPGGRR
ncbi:MAG: phasin family protein [Betaproteobacteria bacterium]